jgi:hypothetical protein
VFVNHFYFQFLVDAVEPTQVMSNRPEGDQSYASQNTDMVIWYAIRHVALDGRQVSLEGDDEEILRESCGERVA